jgi:hypothetical protein
VIEPHYSGNVKWILKQNAAFVSRKGISKMARFEGRASDARSGDQARPDREENRGQPVSEGERSRQDLIPSQWEYLCCHCIVKFDRPSGVTCSFTYECAVCGNTNLRFIHTLEHREDKRQIEVGIECARALMNGSEIPALAENETKRKESWRRRYRTPGRCSTDIVDLEKRGKL